MRDYLILVGVQLKGLFGINRFFRQKGSGAGKTARAVGASLLILFAIAFFVGAAALYNYFFLADLHVSARGRPPLQRRVRLSVSDPAYDLLVFNGGLPIRRKGL